MNTKQSRIGVHKKVWRKFEGDAPLFDDSVAGYCEWNDGTYECQGMRNNSDQKHGIVRKMYTSSDSTLIEASFKNNTTHGLYLQWDNSGNLYAGIYQNDSCKGYIHWDKNWTEIDKSNKDYCLELFSIDDFKP